MVTRRMTVVWAFACALAWGAASAHADPIDVISVTPAPGFVEHAIRDYEHESVATIDRDYHRVEWWLGQNLLKTEYGGSNLPPGGPYTSTLSHDFVQWGGQNGVDFWLRVKAFDYDGTSAGGGYWLTIWTSLERKVVFTTQATEAPDLGGSFDVAYSFTTPNEHYQITEVSLLSSYGDYTSTTYPSGTESATVSLTGIIPDPYAPPPEGAQAFIFTIPLALTVEAAVSWTLVTAAGVAVAYGTTELIAWMKERRSLSGDLSGNLTCSFDDHAVGTWQENGESGQVGVLWTATLKSGREASDYFDADDQGLYEFDHVATGYPILLRNWNTQVDSGGSLLPNHDFHNHSITTFEHLGDVIYSLGQSWTAQIPRKKKLGNGAWIVPVVTGSNKALSGALGSGSGS